MTKEKRARKITNNETSVLEKGRWILGHHSLSETGQNHITAGCLRYCFQLPFCSLLFCSVIAEIQSQLVKAFFFFSFFLLNKARQRWGEGGRRNKVGERKKKRMREKNKPSCLIAQLPAVWQSWWRQRYYLELSLELITVNLFSPSKVAKAWVVTVTRRSCGLSTCSGKACFIYTPLFF